MANQIHPLAVVDPEAKLGDNNIIGPFCVIDKNVVIGDNNKLYNSVTLHFGTRLGNNNEIFPGASISTKPQDLKFQGEETTCEIGDNNSIRENVTISRGTASKGKTTVGNGNLLMENMHIGHDCRRGYCRRQRHHLSLLSVPSVPAYRRIHYVPGRLPHQSGHSALRHRRKRAHTLCRCESGGIAPQRFPP